MLVRKPFAAVAALVAFMASAVAAEWPDRPVKIIFPYAAGSTGDATARLIARRLSDRFGQPFVVENRVGANGVIGTEAVAGSAPDGYTLLWAVTPQIAIAPAMAKVPYDPATDFVPISAVSTNRFALLVNAKVPVRTVPEFVEYANAVVLRAANRLFPVFELVGSRNGLTGQTQLVAVPEIILRAVQHLEVKAGLQLGMTSVTPAVGLRIEMTGIWGRPR